MPGINGKAMEACGEIAAGVLCLKIGGTFTLEFNDGPIVLKRIK
jgi:hypothetical protein